jgi:hypothetical protein
MLYKKTLDKVPQIIEDYYFNKFLIKDIIIKYSIGKSTVIKILKEFGSGGRTRTEYENNKYSCNESFFEKIDSHEKAYWFGFIAADGNIYNGKLQICLNKKDEIHLNEFCKRINYNGPIYNDRNHKRLMICRKKIVEDLKLLGLIENKTLSINDKIFDKIPNQYLASAILGYIDGDGSFSLRKNKKSDIVIFSLVGNKSFLNWICDFFEKKDIVMSRPKKDKRTKQTFYINYYINDIRLDTIFDTLYKDTSLDFLDRKKIKLLKLYDNRPIKIQ